MKRVLWILIPAVIVTPILLSRIDFSKPVDLEQYTPSSDCASAYESLMAAKNATPADGSYDIEQTVRIMNSLDVAQTQSDSFYEFLEYMARQDYRGVAADVLEVKRAMFPVIEEMNELRKEIKELSSIWTCLKGVAASGRLGIGDAAGFAGGTLGAVTESVNVVFEAYKEQKDLKRKTEKRLDRLRRQYIDYIEAYTPVYRKYMDEWNALCLNKDKAYINLYAGELTDALDAAQKVLDQHPVNREGLLLKSIALIRLGAGGNDRVVLSEDAAANQQRRIDGLADYDREIIANQCYFTAQRTLDRYVELYPDRAAPALLLNGIIQEQTGNAKRAIALYEQAAAEYPRQAEALTDLLDSYVSRAYLNQSVEGRYLLNYYHSTMEGAGIFSPNFRKAALYAKLGQTDASCEEIYKHFFRRGSQAVQDCLLSDMQYCENYLYGSFRPMVLESSYLDIKYGKSSKIMGFGKKKGKIDINLVNRTDSRFENVRIFLCIHTVGMYKDDYDVVRMTQTKNVIEPYETVTFEEVDIAPRDIDDITHIRAIVMTDDRICWVDAREFKLYTRQELLQRGFNYAESKLREQGEEFARKLNVSSSNLEKEIADNTSVRVDKKWTGGGTVYVRIPRIVALLSPVFDMNVGGTLVPPSEDKIAGSSIELTFALSDTENISDLCIYGNPLSFTVPIVKRGDGYVAGRVRQM